MAAFSKGYLAFFTVTPSARPARGKSEKKRKLSGMLCHVNLIPLNKVKETEFSASSRRYAEEIAQTLEKSGIPATVRREMGAEIDGACGQLRRKMQ